ncbi:hypothetical protein IIB79_00175, partial [candidate division KSB1 bacterium]|nr:hypothetical protein [candidate division KSB1 bacterium]
MKCPYCQNLDDKVIDSRVVRDGGENGAGIIKGMSVLARGEAEGHDFWVDSVMLRQTAKAINSDPRGVKSRFSHPSLSGDGLGMHLGRVHSARKSGDRVFADLHFIEAAHTAPDGDLAKYIMDLAEQDPSAFGASIVFR